MIHLVAIFQAHAATKRSDSEFASGIKIEHEPQIVERINAFHLHLLPNKRPLHGFIGEINYLAQGRCCIIQHHFVRKPDSSVVLWPLGVRNADALRHAQVRHAT